MKKKNFEGLKVNKIQLNQKTTTESLVSDESEIDIQLEISKIDVKPPAKKKKIQLLLKKFQLIGQ